MPRKKRRRPVTLEGQTLGSGASGTWTDSTSSSAFNPPIDQYGNPISTGDTWTGVANWTLSADGTWMEAQVPAGTTPTDSSITVIPGYPDPSIDTWREPTNMAYISANVGAATDTVSAVGDQIAAIGTGVATTLSTLFQNIVPILIGLAALYVWRESEKGK
ncbi:MAG: hypothetical protein ACYDAK_12895 [Candidatus Limnocylindrales bacterium]